MSLKLLEFEYNQSNANNFISLNMGILSVNRKRDIIINLYSDQETMALYKSCDLKQ